jgi:hypothetical protein
MKHHLPAERTLETVNNLLPLISAHSTGYGDVQVVEIEKEKLFYYCRSCSIKHLEKGLGARAREAYDDEVKSKVKVQ